MVRTEAPALGESRRQQLLPLPASTAPALDPTGVDLASNWGRRWRASSIQHDVDTFQNLFKNAPRDTTHMLSKEVAVYRDDLRDVCDGIFGET